MAVGMGLWIYRTVMPFPKLCDGAEGPQTGRGASVRRAKRFAKGQGCGFHTHLTQSNVNGPPH